MAGRAQQQFEFAGRNGAIDQQCGKRLEQRYRVAFGRIDHATVHQHERIARRRRRQCMQLGVGEVFFVEGVLDQREARRRNVREAPGVSLNGARRGADRPGAMLYRVFFNPQVGAPHGPVGGIADVGHGIAQVRHPWDSGQTVQAQADQVRGGDRVGRPDNGRPVFPGQPQAGRDCPQRPRHPAVG